MLPKHFSRGQEEYPRPQSCRLIPPENSIHLSSAPKEIQAAIIILSDPTKDEGIKESNRTKIENYLLNQRSLEIQHSPEFKDFRVHLLAIDPNKLNGLLSSEATLNASLHDNLAVEISSIIYSGDPTSSRDERVRDWFPEIRNLETTSVESNALVSSFSQKTDFFVIKTPKDPADNGLPHEAVVGSFALNNLRHFLPNFMYVYDLISCSIPALKGKEVLTWCSGGSNQVSYLIVENIKDSVAFSEFILDPAVTREDVLVVFYGLINALNLAHNQYGYTHYDLHAGNIRIRKFSKSVAIPFLGGDPYAHHYLVSQYVPYLIDYGFSRIELERVSLGPYFRSPFQIYSDVSFPLYDTYRIIASLGEHLYSTTNRNEEIVELMEELFSFFEEGTLLGRIEARIQVDEKWYRVPNKFKTMTHQDYLDWLAPEYDHLVLVEEAEVYRLGITFAPIKVANDICSFYELVGSDKIPKNGLEYCEISRAIEADPLLDVMTKKSALKWLNSHFDVKKYFSEAYPRYVRQMDILDMTIKRNIKLPSGSIVPRFTNVNQEFSHFCWLLLPKFEFPVTRDYSGDTDHFLLSLTLIARYRLLIEEVTRMKDSIFLLKSHLKSDTCALVAQGKYTQFKGVVEEINTGIKDWDRYVTKMRAVLLANQDYIIGTKQRKGVDFDRVKRTIANQRLWDQYTKGERKVMAEAAIHFWTVEYESLLLSL